jgi:hypothetical protein
MSSRGNHPHPVMAENVEGKTAKDGAKREAAANLGVPM